MRGCFGEAAAELSGAAAMLLGWRPQQFWDSTPAELALALVPPSAGVDPVDPITIDDLKRRFPDD